LTPSPLAGEGRGGGMSNPPSTPESPLGPFAALVILHWTFLLTLRALPHTPGHDGVRLFLPAFGVLAILGGLGATTVVGRWARWGKVLVVAAIAEGVASVALM